MNTKFQLKESQTHVRQHNTLVGLSWLLDATTGTIVIWIHKILSLEFIFLWNILDNGRVFNL